MNRPGVLRVLFLGVVLVTLGWSTGPVFAGVHGGGGGFHGGGGGFHGGGGYGGWHGGSGGFHGGGGYGGWHGGGWGGYHGGYYGGWHGGWGYGGGYCCGWGFGISFNFAPFWGYYGYPSAYAPYYPYYPYYPNYPYSAYPYYYAPVGGPQGYANPAPPSQTSDNLQNYSLEAQPSAPASQPAPPSNGLTLHEATYRPATVSYKTASAPARGSGWSEHELPAMRPEVQNTIRALRAMPPSARQRQIDSGRYSNLTPQELKVVRYAVDLPL